MSFTFSNAFPNGGEAPDFELLNVVTGQNNALSELKGAQATVIMFICNHCPYVVHIKEHLSQIANEFEHPKVSFVAISSNDVEGYPQDGPDWMKKDAIKHNYPFPYLYDKTQAIAKAYKAACTPDFYVFDGDLKCTYHGRFDGSSPKNSEQVTGSDLRMAIQNTLKCIPIPVDSQKPSSGCNIKWKSGIDPF